LPNVINLRVEIELCDDWILIEYSIDMIDREDFR